MWLRIRPLASFFFSLFKGFVLDAAAALVFIVVVAVDRRRVAEGGTKGNSFSHIMNI